MIDTKAERAYAEAIYRYTTGCDEAAKRIDRLSYGVDRLRGLLAAAKVVQHGDIDSDKPYKALREAIAACEKESDHREHMDLCREQLVELLEAKSEKVNHEDE